MNPNSINLLGYDVETTMRTTRDGQSKSCPWDPDNKVLCAVATFDTVEYDRCFRMITDVEMNKEAPDIEKVLAQHKSVFLVGHNLKFDLAYTYKASPKLHKLLVSLPVWDTQVAEYILSGQELTFPSLDQSLKNHGLPGKNTFLDDLLATGKTPEDAQFGELLEYCESDVMSTLALARKQIEQA